ncbi:hypothetical protein [Aquimarina sp. AU58]|uniref:hypothetical protein n=1 Tax=Aquimarina sp. AU58 TaxID=1874112 RepID=UPI000D6E0E10|nr:hypothetical protein [Aquimarina sp. AU58]
MHKIGYINSKYQIILKDVAQGFYTDTDDQTIVKGWLEDDRINIEMTNRYNNFPYKISNLDKSEYVYANKVDMSKGY